MAQRGQGRGRGQDKTHTIRNPETGEEREITQREWRQQGKDLRDAGFERVDEDEGGDAGELEPEDVVE